MSPVYIGAANSTNKILGNLSSDPSSGNVEGDMYYNTSTDAYRFYDGSNWKNVSEPPLGSSSANPARNAAAIYNTGERTNGYYHIGTSGSSRVVYCVLDANFMSGGGWMIIANHDGQKEQDAGHQPRPTARADQTGSDDGSGDPSAASMVPEKSFSVNMNGVPYTKFAHVVYASSNMSTINTSNMLNPLGYYAGTFNSEKTLPTTVSYHTDQFDNRGVVFQMNGSNLNRRLKYSSSVDWCNYMGVASANSGGDGTFRLNGSGATAANYPVYIGFQAFSGGLGTYTFSFTDSSNSNGWDDFQDGSGMGDNWSIEGLSSNQYRGNPSYIMLQ